MLVWPLKQAKLNSESNTVQCDVGNVRGIESILSEVMVLLVVLVLVLLVLAFCADDDFVTCASLGVRAKGHMLNSGGEKNINSDGDLC